MAYFNAEKMGDPTSKYVAWVDCMGSRMNLSLSLQTSANFMGKFHSALLMRNVECDDINIYPVMDGAYITCEDKNKMMTFLVGLFQELTCDFIKAKGPWHQFIVRGGMAYGPIADGNSIPIDAFCTSNTGKKKKEAMEKYKFSILIGMPMVQANEQENYAPPFGIALHESVRAFAPFSDFESHRFWWRWFDRIPKRGNSFNAEKICSSMKEYFDYYTKCSLETGYEDEKINKHRRMFEQYFNVDLNDYEKCKQP